MNRFFHIILDLLSTHLHAQKITAANIDSFDLAVQKRLADRIGKPLQNFTATMEGQPISNETLKGKTVFINFWFEACEPCVAEFEALDTLYQKLKDNKNFEFIAFTFEEPGKLAALKQKYKLLYHLVSVSQTDCYRLNQNNGFPTSIIIDAKGIIKYIHTGGFTEKEKVEEFMMKEVYPAIVKEL